MKVLRLLCALLAAAMCAFAAANSARLASAPIAKRRIAGVKRASKIIRDAKRWFSSELESRLLQLTRPDNQKIAAADVDALCVQLLEERQCLLAALGKLSRKIAEPDPRTKVKALHLLHLLIQKMKGENLDALHDAFELLLDTTDPKTNLFHFDISHALSSQKARIDSMDLARLLKFVQGYGKYVLLRARHPHLALTSEDDDVSVDVNDIVKLLAAADALQELSRSATHPLVGPCMAAVRIDLQKLQRSLKDLAKSDSDAAKLLRKHQDLFNRQAAKVGPKAGKRLSMKKTIPRRKSV